MAEISLPDNLVQRVIVLENGREWLQSLPTLLDTVASRWSLSILPPFPNLSYNYVAPSVYADGTEAVLKVSAHYKDLASEAAALRAFEGRGCVRLLDCDLDLGVIVLERLRPGTTLTGLADDTNDDKATSVAASVMRELWRTAPPDNTFPSTRDLGQGFVRLRQRFNGGVGPLPAALVERAESLFAEPFAGEPLLLHGDLHHDNILSAIRSPWLAIDPKGLIGDPAYEPGAILRNLWLDKHAFSNPTRILERRLHQLAAELDLDRARILDWCVAHCVLSAWWSIEDNDGSWEPNIRYAELLSEVSA